MVVGVSKRRSKWLRRRWACAGNSAGERAETRRSSVAPTSAGGPRVGPPDGCQLVAQPQQLVHLRHNPPLLGEWGSGIGQCRKCSFDAQIVVRLMPELWPIALPH